MALKLTKYSVLFIVLLFYLVACDGVEQETDPASVRAAYEGYLNLKLPDSVTELSGDVHQSVVELMSNAYFKYRAESRYFDLLTAHAAFAQKSELNHPFYKVDCMSGSFEQDFSFWTTDKIELKQRDCYLGTYFPTLHYIVYDPKTRLTQHFVTSIRG